jgi:D-alanyl-D-alanine carboxypeptidase
VAVAAVCLGLVAAACGDDEDTVDDTVSAEASTVESAPITDSTDAATTDSTAPSDDSGGSAGVEVPTAPMSDADAAVIDDAAMAALAEGAGEVPGMWVGVWDPAKGVHLAAYGDAVAEETPATIDDSGRIGSITKTFTATAVLQQVAAGALSLDDTVADVLPDLAAELPDIADITVEQLLSMQSGIPEYEFLVVPDVLANPTEPIDLDEVIVETVESGVEPAGTAGYSTTNYLILGKMLEELTGQPSEDVLNDLAADAGLTTTALTVGDDIEMSDPKSAGYVNEPAALELQAQGIDVEPLGDVSSYNPNWGGTGGSMYSTIEDLGAWAATGFGNDFLPPELAAQRLEAAPLGEIGVNYGLGLMDFGNGWYGHTGEILGWNSIAANNPETGATFVAYVNESGSLLATFGTAIVAFPDLLSLVGG